MTVAEKLEELNGPTRTGLVALYRGGLVPLRVINDYETYQKYKAIAQLPVYCDQPGQVAIVTAQECGIHLCTVYKVVRAMNAPFELTA